MAQRNPMNERYLGDGPQGKTRKSATKLKPKGEAAASVHIEKKPTNRQERKAARKKRESQLAAKEKERQRKADERDRKEREAAGEVLEDQKSGSFFSKIKGALSAPKKASPEKTDSPAKDAQPVLNTIPTWHGGPDTTEFRRLKYIYYILMAVGFTAIIISIVMSVGFPDRMSDTTLFITMAFAYPAVIGALVLDYGKIRKMQKAHQAGGSGKRSPKQLKHAQQQAEAAMLLEESKKAKKEQKRAQSRLPFSGKPKDPDKLPAQALPVEAAEARTPDEQEE